MHSARVDEAYGQATNRWPGVAFGRAEYAAHVGDPPPPYAVDMYLAGAAGYRVDEAWRAIERELGPATRGILRRQPTADLSVEELWNETLVRLMDEDAEHPPLPGGGGRRPAKIVRYRGLVALLNYLTVVARRAAISRKRGMRAVSGSAPEDLGGGDAGTAAPADPAGATPTPLDDAEAREALVAMQAAVGAAYAQLSAQHKYLIAMVYRAGMLQKKAGALLGWSEFKTSREMNKAIETLRSAMAGVDGARWTAELRGAWSECWSECWRKFAESEAPGGGEPAGGRRQA